MSMTLRPYQQEAIDCLQNRLQTKDTALCVLPTGAGKTVVFAEIIRQMQKKTLVLAHRKELLEQARNKITAVYPESDIGLIGYGQNRYGKDITVASVASLRVPSRLAQLEQEGIELVVVDECHHSMAESYLSILSVLEAKLLGFTATVERLDGKDITELFGEPVYEKSILYMILNKYLVDIRSYAVRSKSTSLDGVSTTGGDYQTARLTSAIDRPDRNEVIIDAYKEYANGLSTIAFAVTVEHAEHLAEAFRDAGISAAALSAETPATQREDLLSKYQAGEIKVLVNVMLFAEGFDAPLTSCIIMARPTKSLSLFKQCLGRGLRLYTDPVTGKEKPECIFIDITDNCTNHQLEPQGINDVFEGIPLRDGLTIIELQAAITEERRKRQEAKRQAEEQEAKQQAMEVEAKKQDEEKERQKQHELSTMDEVLTRRINLFGTQLTWENSNKNSYKLIVGQDALHIEHFGNEFYQVYIEYFNRVGYIPLLKSPIPFEHAQNLCEKYAQTIQSGKGYLLNPHSRWKHEPATEKLLQALAKCNIPIPSNCTKGQAGLLLDLYWSHPSRANKSASKSKAS